MGPARQIVLSSDGAVERARSIGIESRKADLRSQPKSMRLRAAASLLADADLDPIVLPRPIEDRDLEGSRLREAQRERLPRRHAADLATVEQPDQLLLPAARLEPQRRRGPVAGAAYGFSVAQADDPQTVAAAAFAAAAGGGP